MDEDEKEESLESARIWNGVGFIILGVAFIIIPLAMVTFWLIGICGGLVIIGTVFALVRIIDKRLKKRENG